MLYVDTNILLRYLLHDNETLAQTAKTLIEENDYLVKNEVHTFDKKLQNKLNSSDS